MHLHVRFTEYFQCSELIRDTVPQTRDIGSLLQFSGMGHAWDTGMEHSEWGLLEWNTVMEYWNGLLV